MTDVSPQLVKELRDKTGAGMMDCKKALAESGGNIDGAIDILRKKGLKDIGKRADRVAAEGIIYSYVHSGDKVAVLVELNCETDFVGRGDDFRDLAKAIAMHIAWARPKYVRREEIPQSVIQHEADIYRSQLKPEQEKVADKILAGRLEKFYEETCLVDQLDVRDSAAKKRIGDIINEFSAKVGEKVVLKRFVRFEVGEGLSTPPQTH